MPLLDVVRHDGVTTITIDSPRNRNALSAALIAELRQAWESALDDDRTHVLVLTATGTTFCAGADLSEIRDSGGGSVSGADLAGLLRIVMESAKPTIARINGHVRGGGLGLVGACDIAVAPADATFAFPEVRLGVAPAMIAPAVVPRLLPRAASRYLLTGETFDAAEATRIGLLTATTDDVDGLDTLVGDLTAALRKGVPAAQSATKDIIRATGHGLPTDRLDDMQVLSQALFASDEAQRRIAAILDKR